MYWIMTALQKTVACVIHALEMSVHGDSADILVMLTVALQQQMTTCWKYVHCATLSCVFSY